MKKKLTTFFTICSLVIILESFRFSITFMEFFFAGIIPWTNQRISPTFMLVVIYIIIGVLIGRIVMFPILRKFDKPKTKKSSTKIKNRQPKGV
jgi:hypothetical protein